MKTYTIREYQSFITGKTVAGYKTLPERTFAQLEDFILSNRTQDTDALELMGLSARKGLGKVITAKNYVGLITMKDGTTIEILPKIYSANEDNSDVRAKKLLIDMLKTLRNSPYKNMQTSNVNVARMNVFEIFVRMFVAEVFYIVKRGLKCNYETVEENAAFFRGKMLFSHQVRHNYAHKERSYVAYDEFTANRPENRLLKSTLKYLYLCSTTVKNRNDIRILLDSFDDVEVSNDYQGDFSKYVPDRNMKDYSTALTWCRVFLEGKSFTSFAGSEVALALLFPMETLFESYVASLLKKTLDPIKYTVSAQDQSYHLFDEPAKKFRLRPDIVVTRKKDNALFVLDTKWKLLSEAKPNYGISQSDMYQMYVYQKKYDAQRVLLLYPCPHKALTKDCLSFSADDGAEVQAHFIDLFHVKESITGICNQLMFNVAQ